MECVIDDVEVHYESIGEGRPLVALHGWPADHHHVRNDLEPVFVDRPGWRRIYPDLPGMGQSPGNRALQSQADVVTLVARFVEQVAGGERFVVAGTSYGAYVGRWLSALHGDRMDGFLAYVPAFTLDDSPRVPPATVLVPDATVTDDLGEDEALWASANTVHSREALESFRTLMKPAFARADHEFLGRLGEVPAEQVPIPMPSPFPAPTLILAGRQDSWVGYADAWDVLEDYRRATFAVLDRAAHGLADEQQALFRILVSEWLDRVEEYIG